ncbi:ABC transporter substrate-binding protein [Devosia sp. 2618]|uniref:ABC transporter substrate-binding protein n=1 Tax=Devosia sp. 2618 TaxID=3156454 RepID=UPI0033976DE2
MLPRHFLLAVAFTALVAPAFAQETFTYTYGDYTAELPVDPQRVFVMDSRTALDFAVSAGFPIVATDWDDDEEMHLDKFIPENVDRLIFRGEPNAELVLTYDPDLLVVGAGWWNYWKDNNSFNANGLPVLVIKDGTGPDWKEQLTSQLAAYNRPEKGAALIAEYDAAVAAARPEIARVLHGRKVAVTDIWGDQFALQTETFSAAVARDLGIDLATGPVEAEDGYQVYSAENLGAYHDAALIMSLWSKDMADNAMWQRLPAIARGAQYEMDTVNSWGFALTAIDLVQDFTEAMAVLEKADAQ